MSTQYDIKQALKEYLQNKPSKLHALCKSGLCSHWRPSVWIYCVEGSNISETVDEDNLEYNLEFKTAIRDNSLDYDNFPLFGGSGVWTEYSFLNREKQRACIRIMYLIYETNYIQYAPQIFDVTCLLLSYLDESRAYKIVCAMLQQSQQDFKYFILSEQQDRAMIECIQKYIHKFGSSTLSSFLKKCDSFPTQHLLSTWIHRLFSTWLSPDNVLRIFDAYLLLGMTVLIKECIVILEVISSNISRIDTQNSLASILALIKEKSSEFSPVPELDHLNKAFKQYSKLTHSKFVSDMKNTLSQPSLTKNVSNLKLSDLYKYHNVKIWDGTLLSTSLYNPLRPFLPNSIAGKDLKLIYNATIDGYHLDNLYRMCSEVTPTLLVASILETQALIGIYCEEEWKPSNRPSCGLDMLLIQFSPTFKCWKAMTQKKYKNQNQSMTSLVSQSNIPSFYRSNSDESEAYQILCSIATSNSTISPLSSSSLQESQVPQPPPFHPERSTILEEQDEGSASTTDSDNLSLLSDDELDTSALLTYDIDKFIYRIATTVDISVGVYKTNCAFHINDDFSVASSTVSPVFGNEPLGGSLGIFTIRNIEVYSFIEPLM